MNKLFATAAALGLCACAAQAPKQAGDSNTFTQPTTASEGVTSGGETSGSAAPTESPGGLNEVQKEQMTIALRRGGEKAAKCADVVENAVRGEGEVRVLFDGQKGRVTDATVGPPFAGTPVEACIKRAFVGEIVIPFDGDPLEVPYGVKLPEKKGPADKKKTKK